MSHKSVQRENKGAAVPGTCNQTGNKAPRPRWPAAIRVLIHRIAHFLDYNDDQMWRLRDFPSPEEVYEIFSRTVPWFAEWYDSKYESQAKEDWSREKWELFRDGYGPKKVHNRLRYLFDEPGQTKSGKPRRYGISVEHPDNPKGNRRGVDVSYSEEIFNRLRRSLTISQEEIEDWSKS